MLGKGWEIGGAVAEGRDFDLNDIDSVVEVLAELA